MVQQTGAAPDIQKFVQQFADLSNAWAGSGLPLLEQVKLVLDITAAQDLEPNQKKILELLLCGCLSALNADITDRIKFGDPRQEQHIDGLAAAATEEADFGAASKVMHRKHYEALKDHIDRDFVAALRDSPPGEIFSDYRHMRYMSFMDVLADCKGDSWLTVGDGRYGLDAFRLRRGGFDDVMATDIGPTFMEVGAEMGLIDKFQVEDAENLSFADGHFDWALCKDSLHHLPRPVMGIYEMLRVSNKGIVLVEPNDFHAGMPSHGVNQVSLSWESSGNYVYRIDIREMVKLGLSLNLPAIAFMEWDEDHSVTFGNGTERQSDQPQIFRDYDALHEKHRLDCAAGRRRANLLSVILFKQKTSAKQRRLIKANGWTLIELPENPMVPGA